MKWIVVVLTLVSLTGGCVTLTPVQRDAVVDVQHFADATTNTYKLTPIRLTIEPATNLGIGGRYRQGNFYLNETQLGSGGRDALVAHELAHYVLGHDSLLSGAATMAEAVRMQELRELDANAKAVEILVRAKGLTERQALTMMVLYLRGAMAYQTRTGSPNPQGHRPVAEEIADLQARFPGVEVGAAPVTRAMDTITVSSAEPVRAPIWKAGDQWTYWWANPTGAGTFRWSVDREETVDGQEDYVVRLGTQREFFYRKSDLAVHLEKTSGEVQVRYTPSEPRYPWPLTVGAEKHEEKITRDQTKPPSVETRSQTCRVESEESVTVRAGTFRTFKVECRSKPGGDPTFRAWYSPEVKNWIRDWRPVKDGALERELISYTLR